MPKSPLLTSAEVAEKLHISTRTVARLAESGDLPVAQRLPGVRGALFFDERAVERYRRSTERAAQSATG